MLDQLFSESKDLDDTLSFPPGVVVQKNMSMQGMSDLYKIKRDLLERLIKSPSIEPLRLGPPRFGAKACSSLGFRHRMRQHERTGFAWPGILSEQLKGGRAEKSETLCWFDGYPD